MSAASHLPSILIVDDEESIRQLLEYNFTRSGFRTESVDNGQDAYVQIKSKAFDIVLLDVMLPGMDGMDLCKKLRQENVTTPIILVTARDDEVDRILGLEIGADDYVTKPFSPRELVARARAVLRRAEAQAKPDEVSQPSRSKDPITVGDITIDLASHEVTANGKYVELTPKEFALLHFLMLHPNRVISRDELLKQIWGYSGSEDTRMVDVHISHLREKIEANPKEPKFLRTVRGIGYKITDGSIS
jgi:two-component system, OmpR family, alkaline phosphatase synthesis response regulator PhoP